MEKIKRPPPSGPHWAEMGESLDTSVQPPRGYLHRMPAASQQTWESHPLLKHTQASFLPDPHRHAQPQASLLHQ